MKTLNKIQNEVNSININTDEYTTKPQLHKHSVIASFSDLKIGDTIKLLQSGETFRIDKIFQDGHVDMTATKKYNPEMGFDWHEKFFSIRLVNFEIVS